MILRTLFGFYHKINKRKSFIYFVKMYCLTYIVANGCFIFGVIIFTNMLSNNIVLMFSLLELLALLLSSLFIEESSFLNFCTGIKTIHRLLSMSQRQLEAPSLYILYLQIMLKIIYTAFRLWSAANTLVTVTLICFTHLMISAYLYSAPSIATFDLFCSTMKNIRISLETKLNASCWTNDVKAEIIIKHLFIYKHLLDNMQDNSKMLKIFVSTSILRKFVNINVNTGRPLTNKSSRDTLPY